MTVRPVGAMLLTPAEAAVELRIGKTVLYRLLGKGDIESVKIGGARRIPRDALERYVESLREVT